MGCRAARLKKEPGGPCSRIYDNKKTAKYKHYFARLVFTLPAPIQDIVARAKLILKLNYVVI
jgi:hypothetical protein